MKRILALTLFAALSLTGCEKQPDMNDVPGPNGLLPDGSPPRAPGPPIANPGTYDGRIYGNQRPPMSGINSDPNNPSGAPGNYSSNSTMR